MTVLAAVFVVIVAALHAGFLALEMFLWCKPFGLRTFHMTQEVADSSAGRRGWTSSRPAAG